MLVDLRATKDSDQTRQAGMRVLIFGPAIDELDDNHM
jgi:hypothetical protein